MERFLDRTKYLRAVLAFLMLCDIATVRALAEDATVKLTKTEFVGDTVYLFYDLSGTPEQVFTITLIMKKHSDPKYQYAPKFVTGDVGSSMFSGTGWRIAWNFSREFPSGIDQKDVYFVVEARAAGEAVSTGRSNTMLWIAGGAVVAGGIVALLLLNKNEPEPPSGQFPPPPGRP